MTFTCLYSLITSDTEVEPKCAGTLTEIGAHLISHFRIPLNFFFKASLSAQFLLLILISI